MKKKLMLMSTILLISIGVAGNTFSWFSASSNKSEEISIISTIGVEVLEKNSKSLSNIKTKEYTKNIKVKSLGTGETYIRVRLIPEWSNHNLSISNVKLNLSNNSDWIFHKDGYYYFKYYLNENQITSELIKSITFTSLPAEYDGENFTLKVVAEGVQKNNKALKTVWGIDKLPFTADKPWSP